MCGDQGRRAELMRLESSHAQLAKVFEARSGHAANAVLVLDTISGCARWGSYRPSVIEARLALAEAHAALGLGE